MRLLSYLAAALVVLFWLSMNGLLVWRQVEYQSLDHYRRGVTDFLGERVRRERWMGIYQNQRRIGHTGFAIERSFEGDRMGFRVEFSTHVDLDLFGSGGRIDLDGTAALDVRMIPENLAAEIGAGTARFNLEGRRQGEHFQVTLREAGRVVFQQKLPLQEFHFGDGLAPVPPIAGLRVGETYRVPIFDPIFRESAEAEIVVEAAVSREVDGVPLDCFQLQTRFRSLTFRSFITRDGEVLRQEIPPPLNVVLVREPAPTRRDRP